MNDDVPAIVRVELHVIRNAVTAEECVPVRVAPADDSRHVVAVVTILRDERFLLLGRHRGAIDRWSLEFPKFWDRSSDAGWRQSVEAKLFEDTGLAAENLKLLGAIHVDPQSVSISTLVIVARGCSWSRGKRTDTGRLMAGAVALSSDELDARIRRGDVVCGATLSALALYRVQRPD